MVQIMCPQLLSRELKFFINQARLQHKLKLIVPGIHLKEIQRTVEPKQNQFLSLLTTTDLLQ